MMGSLNTSVVGLGGNNFGTRCNEERSIEVIGAALDAGINFFDTADAYGGTLSEQFLAKALQSRRSEAIIATKFGAPIDSDPEHRGASGRWVTQAAEDSLRRLGTDYIDLYYQHLPDSSVPIEETLHALDGLVRAGKVREIGNSNFSADQIGAADQASMDHGWPRMVSAQNHLNLLNRRSLDKVVPTCERLGVAFVPYFPLAAGVLTGKYKRSEPPASGTRLAGQPERQVELLTDQNFDLLDRLAAFAELRGHSLLELAFGWLVSLPATASVIAGATSPEQVRANVAGAEWQLNEEELSQLDQIFSEG
jgi:aryl-alcohol dehydrogenase-like predicted oxidoreductase